MEGMRGHSDAITPHSDARMHPADSPLPETVLNTQLLLHDTRHRNSGNTACGAKALRPRVTMAALRLGPEVAHRAENPNL